MATVTTNHEKYSRLALMLVKGGTKVTRALFEKCYKEMTPENHVPFPWTIDEFLLANRTTILSNQTGRNKEQIFFPGASVTGIDHWDLYMFCFVLLDVCKVSRTIRMDVDQLRKMRNKLCHLSEPSLDASVYGRYVDKIEVNFERLLAEVGDELLKKEIANVLQTAKEGPLAIQDTLNIMHQFYSMEGDTRQCLSNLSKDFKVMMEKLKEMEMKLDLVLINQKENASEAVKVSETFIELLVKNCDSDKEVFISKLLVTMYKEVTGGSTDALPNVEYSNMFAAVRETVERFTSKNRPIVDAEEKCVSLRIRCSSVASLVSLFDDCIAGDLNKDFKQLEACLREIKGCEEVTLEAVMFEDDVWKTISKTISSMEEMITRWYSTAVQSSTASQNSDIPRISNVNLVDRRSPSSEDDMRVHHAVRLTIRTDQIGKDQLKQSIKDESLDISINRLKEEIVDQFDLTKLSIEARVVDEESSISAGAFQNLVDVKTTGSTMSCKEENINEDTFESGKESDGAVSKYATPLDTQKEREQIQEILVTVQELHKELVQHRTFKSVLVQADPIEINSQQIKPEDKTSESKDLSQEIACGYSEQHHDQTRNKNVDKSKTHETLKHQIVEFRRRSLQLVKGQDYIRKKHYSTIENKRASFDERECLANALQFHVEIIVDGIVFHESELPDCLLADGCLTEDECAGVRKLRDRKDQIRILLSLIKGRDLRVLKGFVKHIENHNHNVAAKIQAKFEENKSKGIKSKVCTLCQLKKQFNIKHVVDSLWANDLIDDGLYNTITYSESPVGAQNELWDSIFQNLKCLDENKVEIANEKLLIALRSKNLFTHLADCVQSMLDRNYGKLVCSCEPKLNPGLRRDSSTRASTSTTSFFPDSSIDGRIDSVGSIGTQYRNSKYLGNVTEISEDLTSLTGRELDINEKGYGKVPRRSISGHNSLTFSTKTTVAAEGIVLNQANATTPQYEIPAIPEKPGIPKQPLVKGDPRVAAMTSNLTQIMDICDQFL